MFPPVLVSLEFREAGTLKGTLGASEDFILMLEITVDDQILHDLASEAAKHALRKSSAKSLFGLEDFQFDLSVGMKGPAPAPSSTMLTFWQRLLIILNSFQSSRGVRSGS